MTRQTRQEFVASLKPGDEVVVETFGSSRIETVKSVTRTRVRIGCLEFDRQTGNKRGDAGHWIPVLSPEGVFKVRLDTAASAVRRMTFMPANEERLRRIVAVLEAPDAR